MPVSHYEFGRHKETPIRDHHEWLKQLWIDNAGMVYAYVVRRVGTSHAEDLVAEVFVVAWRRRQTQPDRPLPWLYGIARRVVSQYRRGAVRRNRLGAKVAEREHDVRDSIADQVVESAVIRRAMEDLSQRDREMLYLWAWEGLDSEDAGAVLGISASSYRMRVSRARARFRSAYASYAHSHETSGESHGK
jgi:RNA polymerase sigma-70 factor (ECF subfamily)